MHYDYLIVGAGLFGSVFARQAADCGKKCLVIDRRDHIGGNIYTENVNGINVHKYGAHIFHTSDEHVWEYVNRFTKFNNYVNSPVARFGDEMYNLPFNMNTFVRLFKGVLTPDDARRKIEEETAPYRKSEPKNLEEQALYLVGKTVYEKLVKGYTEKQWGRDCKDLPAFIIKRLPLRFTFDNNYFNDRYQGIPIGGYTRFTENLLNGIEVKTGVAYKEFIANTKDTFEKTVYTGAVDEFFDYNLGALEYRTVRFETEVLDTDDFQGNAVVNYTERQIPYTRIIEHKHFEFGKQSGTVISREFPAEWSKGIEPYYPVNDGKNSALYQKYARQAEALPNVIFGGRLGRYAYYDMDKVIAEALSCADGSLSGKEKN